MKNVIDIKRTENPTLFIDTYHHTAGEGNATAAVRVGNYITVADTEERNSCQPH